MFTGGAMPGPRTVLARGVPTSHRALPTTFYRECPSELGVQHQGCLQRPVRGGMHGLE